MKTIAFDEAGNTGQNLLDQEQQIYALAAVCFNEEETNELKGIFSTKSEELHFSQLRKNYDKHIIEFLNHDLIINSKIKYSISNKKFELIARLADILVEPVFYEKNLNFYENGLHLAFSNMLYIFSVTQNQQEKMFNLLACFQKMIRKKSNDSIKEFYSYVKEIKKDFLDNFFIERICDSEELIGSILSAQNKYSIDPAYPAFISLSNKWHYTINEKFNIVHDNSKQIDYWQELIKFFSNEEIIEEEEQPILFGAKVKYPLQINQLQLCDSKENKQLQLADIIASSLAYALNKKTNGEPDDLADEILKSKITSFEDIRCLFPSMKITPEELGTKDTKNDESLNALVSIIENNKLIVDEIEKKMK